MAGDKISCSSIIDNINNDMTDREEANSHSDLEDEIEDIIECLTTTEFEFSTCTCCVCNGYYGPCFGEPVCATCHAFLFPDDIGAVQPPISSEKTDDEDSGNDEPVDLYYNAEFRECQNDQTSQDSTPITSSPSNSPDQNRAIPFFQNEVNECIDLNGEELPHNNNDNNNRYGLNLDLGNVERRQDVENFPQHDVLEEDFQSPEEDSVAAEDPPVENNVQNRIPQPSVSGESSRLSNLSARLNLLTNYNDIDHKVSNEGGVVERLPPEVLLAVFSHLDDVSLWCAANVCRRWFNLLSTHVTQQQWQQHVKLRWPLYKSKAVVQDWYKVYDHLASSSPCKTCLSQTSIRTRSLKMEENSWRRNRLRMELKNLRIDPPEGIEATPLDQMCCHWQATITGPTGSPYEGGLFYLYLQVPYSYPMGPPVVRFLTKILHPNVSRHGDVGIDSIHHNWSLALTISKVLISVQSLLTDPYCQVCMEPELGEMYVNDRTKFEKVARAWTCKYAMDEI